MPEFEAAYGKTPTEMAGLILEEEHFRVRQMKCTVLSPRTLLSHLETHQPLIVVFGEFVPTARLKSFNLLTLGGPRILF